MLKTMRIGMVLLGLSGAVSGCHGSPAAPTQAGAVPPKASLVVFTDIMSGASTSDVHDAQEQIVRFNTARELIWVADDTRLPGFVVVGDAPTEPAFRVTGKICPEGCDFDVRFGTKNGERRAYLTVDYGHSNPGTVVDVEVANGQLVVTQTNAGPPGTYTLSGMVTESTGTGQAAVEGVLVQLTTVYRGGYRGALTDASGVYRIPGLDPMTSPLSTYKDGYQVASKDVSITGDATVNLQVTRQ